VDLLFIKEFIFKKNYFHPIQIVKFMT